MTVDNTTYSDEYKKRFGRHFPELRWLYGELYGDNSPYFDELCDRNIPNRGISENLSAYFYEFLENESKSIKNDSNSLRFKVLTNQVAHFE